MNIFKIDNEIDEKGKCLSDQKTLTPKINYDVQR